MFLNVLYFILMCGIVFLASLVNCVAQLGQCDRPGERYYKTVQNACLHILCLDGREIYLHNHMCRDESGNCHKPGQVLTLSQCMTKTCVLKESRLFYEISTQACSIEGQCVNLDSTLTLRCVTYRCVKVDKGNNNYILKLEVLEVGCQDTKGVCHSVGARVKQNHCLEQTCKLTKNGIGFELTKAECYDSEQGVCRRPGEQWTLSNCQGVTCEKSTSVDGTISLRVKTKSVGCPGDAGECYIPNDGKMFMKRMENTSQQCQCISSNDGLSKPQYQCYSYRSEK